MLFYNLILPHNYWNSITYIETNVIITIHSNYYTNYTNGGEYMKVIFLDIDGVLNSEEFLKNNPNEQIDRKNVEVLKTVIDKTNAAIVMSSGWKLWFDDNMMPKEGYSQYLYDILCEFNIRIVDKTPDFSTDEIRANKTFSHVKAKEIIAWLNEHRSVEKYAILDDLDLENEEINEHLIRTNSHVGITEADGLSIIEKIS